MDHILSSYPLSNQSGSSKKNIKSSYIYIISFKISIPTFFVIRFNDVETNLQSMLLFPPAVSAGCVRGTGRDQEFV